MRKAGENIGVLLLMIIGIVVFIVAVPILLLWSLFTWPKRLEFDKKYNEFLQQNDGKNFFCYNDRKNAKEYIDHEIIPQLKDVEIVYLNGKVVETPNFSKDFISRALYNLKNYSKFPHLMKIRQGELIDKSINNLFFSVKNQSKPKSQLLAEIEKFFEPDAGNEKDEIKTI
ncbi:hypothetical protein ACTJIJ_08745 [Niabella sp. 22666]|uniref:hypothetical protein n=1 Tax=Niabella sp. 22666 TaxID=3453954 RepID=UPI003F82C49F